MSGTDAVTTSSAVPTTSINFDAGMTTLSADALLAYCQAQLGDLDSQIDKQMTNQKTALREREAVQSAQSILNQFGTVGPKSPDEMKQCVDALDNAIKQLPTNDPVVTKLADFRDQMTNHYHYVAGRTLTDPEKLELSQAQAALKNGVVPLNIQVPGMGPLGERIQTSNPQDVIDRLTAVQTGTFTPPEKGTNEWQTGTTDALNNISTDIKSSADIQLLQLQDLVSQRQQAIQLCSGMMSKTDQTLEDQAKAIGR
jgi:hypothetical protein